MNRRSFLRHAFASTATIVVAPAAILDVLHDALRPRRTYVDIGRNLRPPYAPWNAFDDPFDLDYIRKYYKLPPRGFAFAALL